MSTDQMLAGFVGLVIGWIAGACRAVRPAAGDWRIERRIDALLAHHGVRDALKLPDEVARFLHDGRKIDAIRAYRAAKGVGLKEAHDAVTGRCAAQQKLDALLAHLKIEPDRTVPADVRRLAGEGRMIEAIKLLREQTGLELATAKEAIESGRMPI